MIEQTTSFVKDHHTTKSNTVIFDYFCPVCRTGYLGWVRIAAGHEPVAGVMTKSGHCSRCRKWREVDVATGVPRTRPTTVG